MGITLVVGDAGPIRDQILELLEVRVHQVVAIGAYGVEVGNGIGSFEMPADFDEWDLLIGRLTLESGPITAIVDLGNKQIIAEDDRSSADRTGDALRRIEGCVTAVVRHRTADFPLSIVVVGPAMGTESALGITGFATLAGSLYGLVRGYAVELGELGVRANYVSPGLIRIPGVNDEQRSGEGFGLIPLARGGDIDRAGRPRDVAEVVAFLSGDDSSYISGIQFVVDGGLSQSRSSAASLFWDRQGKNAYQVASAKNARKRD